MLFRIKSVEFPKRYLTINQTAKLIGVTTLTLRNWDNARKFRAARHPINNYRMYTLEQIEGLLKRMGLPRPPKKLVIQVLED